MGSWMAEHFKIYGWLCRATGVFFVKNLQAADIDELVVTWKSWYTLYSMACLLVFASMNIAFVAPKMVRFSVDARFFTRSLFLVVPAAVAIKVTVNVCSAILGSWTMLEFFRKSAKYEKRTSFLSEKYRYKSWTSYSLRLFMVVAFSANLAATAHLTMSTPDSDLYYYLDLVLKVSTISVNFLFFFYDMLHSVVMRPCCEVLITYVRHQHDVLKTVLPITGNAAMNSGGIAELQIVRLNLRSIGKLRRLLNTNWHYSLMASSAVLLVVGCISVYCIFDKGVPGNQLLLTLSYCSYSTLDLIDLAHLSHVLSYEVQEIKDNLARTPMHQTSPEQLRQVAYLHNSLRPEELSLCGGNFFTLDLPLLVSLAGSIITYSVILVQTSDSVETTETSTTNQGGMIAQ